MATVQLACASIDERGKISGGKAGNQTGRELRIRKYYVHSKGWRVLRCIHPEMRPLIAKLRVYCPNSAPMPAGFLIQIYGVRA